MKKDAKRLIKDAEALGYLYVGSNTKGHDRYECPGRPAFVVSSGTSESTVRDIRLHIGLDQAAPKRNAVACRERQAKERERQQQQLERDRARRDALLAEKRRMLSGHAVHLTATQVLDIERRIQEIDRDIAATERLMTEVPAGREHRGATTRHQAGAT